MVITKANSNEDFKTYYLTEVALRNGKDMNEVWIIVKDAIYDVTAYVATDNHPGGPELILEYAGKDCTKAFNDAGHSVDAIKVMKAMKIGELVEADRKVNRGKIISNGAYSQEKKKKKLGGFFFC